MIETDRSLARLISSRESSWTKQTPASPRPVLPGRSAPGSAFTNSLGASLGASQSAWAAAIAAASAGTPSTGISRGQVSVGCRPSPGSANGPRYSPISRRSAQDGSRQDPLDEGVVPQDHRLAMLGTARLQERTHDHLVPAVPGLRPHDRLRVCNAFHGDWPSRSRGPNPGHGRQRSPARALRVLREGCRGSGARRSDTSRRHCQAACRVAHGAMQRQCGCRCGSTLRQRYDEVGLPCNSTTGWPRPTSTYAISRPRTRRRCFWYGKAAEIMSAAPR
jgi:hypothetical protein